MKASLFFSIMETNKGTTVHRLRTTSIKFQMSSQTPYTVLLIPYLVGVDRARLLPARAESSHNIFGSSRAKCVIYKGFWTAIIQMIFFFSFGLVEPKIHGSC